MSETVMVDDVAVERVPREQRRQSQQDEARADEPQVTVADIGGDDPTDPERMLEESRAAIQERDRQVADANRRAREAENNAARARDEAARANMARVGDRAAAVASALETAKADLAAARIAYKAAREAGDVNAELSAQEMISSATFRQNQAAGELAGYDARAQGGAQPQREPTSGAGDGGTDPESRAWLDSHPQFYSDAAYRALAEGAHGQAIQAGRRVGTREYVEFIDKMVEQVYGPGHGQGGKPVARRGEDMSGNGGGNAGPTNRGGGGGGAGGGRTVQTQFGGRVLQVHRRSDGKLHIQIPQADREDWNEAAKINNMSLGEYCLEQVNVAEEMKAGGNAGWIKGD